MSQNGPPTKKAPLSLEAVRAKADRPGDRRNGPAARSGIRHGKTIRCRTDPPLRRYRHSPAQGPAAETHAENGGLKRERLGGNYAGRGPAALR